MSYIQIQKLLSELELKGALEAFESFLEEPSKIDNTPATVILENILINERNVRARRKQENLLKISRIPQKASATDIIYDQNRDNEFKSKIANLLTLDFVTKMQNVTIFGNAGSGKSYIASVLARQNCMHGNSTLYMGTREMIELLGLSKGSISYRSKLRTILGKTLLVIDDFCLTEYSPEEKEILFDVLDGRYQKKSTIIISQKTPNLWLEKLGNDSLAESIVERASTNNYKLTLIGDSRRVSIE